MNTSTPPDTSGQARRVPRIAVTAGEPAGIGPDLVASLAQQDRPEQIVVIGDPELLRERARILGVTLELEDCPHGEPRPAGPGRLFVAPVDLPGKCRPGTLNPAHAGHVLATLRRACHGCMDGEFAAMVTTPVHKGVINDAGTPFSGHTELLAELTGSPLPVMMLVAGRMRVALLTTHLPLRQVPDEVTVERLTATVRIVNDGLIRLFGITTPKIAVLGLNPHAGESGHLGTEEIEIMAPALDRLRGEGLDLAGPLPADTAFTPPRLKQFDAVLAMYHDQGLPVLKHAGFSRAVNLTLGLPIIRTSVDHGTALELAGTGRAHAGSLFAALDLAATLARQAPA